MTAHLADDLASRDPARVALALHALDRAWRERRFVVVPMPGPECLDGFADGVPADVLEAYVSVLQHYPAFVPTLANHRHACLEATLRHGRGEGTLALALELQIDDFPASAAADALGYILERGLDGPDEVLAVERFVDHLLDSDRTRTAVIDALCYWVMTASLPAVVARVRPRLDAQECARLDAAAADA